MRRIDRALVGVVVLCLAGCSKSRPEEEPPGEPARADPAPAAEPTANLCDELLARVEACAHEEAGDAAPVFDEETLDMARRTLLASCGTLVERDNREIIGIITGCRDVPCAEYLPCVLDPLTVSIDEDIERLKRDR